MQNAAQSRAAHVLGRLKLALSGPQLIAFLPAILLCGYWFGGETALVVCALILPAALAAGGLMPSVSWQRPAPSDGVTGLPFRGAAVAAIDAIMQARLETGRTTACLAIEIDDFETCTRRNGPTAADDILAVTARRIAGMLREDDLLVRLEGPAFALVLAPLRRADLEMLIQLSARLQAAVAEPINVDGGQVYVSASIGFCLPGRAPAPTGAAFLEAAMQALTEARRHGPGSVRTYSAGAFVPRKLSSAMIDELEEALEAGHIRPFFQPQISTETAQVSGMEALARWQHPERGLIPPMEFLPGIRQGGLFERLGDVMLKGALTALRTWDKADAGVPAVAVNFSAVELSDPGLVDRVRWELDRLDIAAERLTVEILEDVIAQGENDTITRNVWALSELGCRIDLDDFGTGHASIANIRRFGVDRIKIDRSYVTRVDKDSEQQDMVAAILTMADRLKLDTLAEGVETKGEYSILAQLGCGHLQGYSIAHPMAFDDTFDWLRQHRENVPRAPDMQGRAS